MLQQLQKLKDKKVKIKLNKKAKNYILQESRDSEYGARVIQRFIDENIAQELTDEILFGTLRQGGEVHISIKDNELKFDYE